MDAIKSISQLAGNAVQQPDGTSYYTGIEGPKFSTGPKEVSEKDMFLKLMIEQMKQQDPLKPMDSTGLLSQLAQLNSVQQMIELNMTFQRFMSNQDLIQANNLMGRWVEGVDANAEFIDGKVDWIEVIDGAVALHVGDKLLLLHQVTGVRTEERPLGDEGSPGEGGLPGSETGGAAEGGEG